MFPKILYKKTNINSAASQYVLYFQTLKLMEIIMKKSIRQYDRYVV
jgi:hypothetical protein